MWSIPDDKRKEEILAIRQSALDLFFGSSNGVDVLLYLLRAFLKWNYPMNSPDDASRQNAAKEIVEFLMGPDDPSVSDSRYADMLRAAVDFTPSVGDKLREKGEGWHDAKRNRRKRQQ